MDEMKMQYCRGKKHVVKEGDTLYQIGRMYRVPLHVILRANPGVDVYNLQIGQEICVPEGRIRPMPHMPHRPHRPWRREAEEMDDGAVLDMSSLPENPEPPCTTETESAKTGGAPYRVLEIKKVCNLEDFLKEHDFSMESFLYYNDISSLYLLPCIEIKAPLVDKE